MKMNRPRHFPQLMLILILCVAAMIAWSYGPYVIVTAKREENCKNNLGGLSPVRKSASLEKVSTATDTPNSVSKDDSSVEFTDPIDLDMYVPPDDLLYKRLVLVTAASENHHREMLGFIGSAQRVMPDKQIIVYDLGLENATRDMISSLCNVKLRRFPFERYPPHVQTLGKFGWKAAVVNDALNKVGIIYYGDSSVRFHRPVKGLISNGVQHHGFVPHIRCFNPQLTVKDAWGCKHDYQVTAKEVYPILGVDEAEYANANFSAPAVSATVMFVMNNTFLQTNLLKPWLNCSMNEDCIAPKSSSRKNHRFDQSALTLLFFKNMRGEWTRENNPTPDHLAFMSIQRGSDGYLWYPQTCKGNV